MQQQKNTFQNILYQNKMQPIKFDQVVHRDEKVDSFCKCSICLEVFQDPICCENCENHFCSLCIVTWNQSQPNRRCPLCHDLKEKPAQRILKNLLSSLQVYCGNRHQGCQQIIQYDDYQKHMSNECQFKLVKCKNPGCNKEIFLGDSLKHDEQCQLKILICQWCKLEVKRMDKQNHEGQCPKRCVPCDICNQLVLYSELKNHIDICPEKIIECQECQEAIHLKNRDSHLLNVCQKVKVECLGCQNNCPRYQIQAHQDLCPDFLVECDNCEIKMKRKDLSGHELSNCVKILKQEMQTQKQDFIRIIQDLKDKINQLDQTVKHLYFESQQFKPKTISSIKFSSVHKHPEIFLFQQNTYAQIQDNNSILKDRFVYLEIDKDQLGGPIEVTFFFANITDRFVAFGIADLSNLSQKKDYYKLNHLAYLFSANGVIYSSHSSEENGRKRDFRFDPQQKVTLIYDPINCRVSAQNLTTNQSHQIDIPYHLIQMYGKSFYPVVCLRGTGDQVHILN